MRASARQVCLRNSFSFSACKWRLTGTRLLSWYTMTVGLWRELIRATRIIHIVISAMEEQQSNVASLLYELYNPTGKPSSSPTQDAQQQSQSKIAKKGRREKGRGSNTVVVNKNKEINYHFHVYSPRPAKQKKRKFNQTTQSEHEKPSHQQGQQTQQQSTAQKMVPWNADSHLALLSGTLRCIELYRTVMFPFLPLHPCVFEEGNVAHLLSTHEVSLDQVPLRLNTFACLAIGT